MNKNNIALIAVIGAIIAAAVFFLRLPLSQSAVLDFPFDAVTQYMNDVFKVDVTASQTDHPSTMAPHFLATNTDYFIETEKYEREKLLRFQARFGQIGAEYNTFTIEKIDAATTRLTVNQTVWLFIPILYLPREERAIIDAIKSDLEKRNCPEQSVYDPQAVALQQPLLATNVLQLPWVAPEP